METHLWKKNNLLCANSFKIASFHILTVWQEMSSYSQLEHIVQEIQLETSMLVVGYMKNDLKLWFAKKN